MSINLQGLNREELIELCGSLYEKLDRVVEEQTYVALNLPEHLRNCVCFRSGCKTWTKRYALRDGEGA